MNNEDTKDQPLTEDPEEDNLSNTSEELEEQEDSDDKPVIAYFLESKNECMLNPLCYEADDDEFGTRFPGGFALEIEDNGHPCNLLTYDNGDQYLYDREEKMLYRLGKLDQSHMIHKYLEKLVYDYADYYKIEIRRPFHCVVNEIDPMSFVRLLINHDDKIVYITNLGIPYEKKHQNIGKDLIADIYRICNILGFRLILLDVVPHFFEALRRRGALVNDYDDSVEITDTTDLKSRFKKDIEN